MEATRAHRFRPRLLNLDLHLPIRRRRVHRSSSKYYYYEHIRGERACRYLGTPYSPGQTVAANPLSLSLSLSHAISVLNQSDQLPPPSLHPVDSVQLPVPAPGIRDQGSTRPVSISSPPPAGLAAASPSQGRISCEKRPSDGTREGPGGGWTLCCAILRSGFLGERVGEVQAPLVPRLPGPPPRLG